MRRSGRGYELTPFAEGLLPEVVATLESISATLDPRASFDPANSTRRFMISASDYALAVLLEPLLEVIGRRAPGITVKFDDLPGPATDKIAHLIRRDLMIGSMSFNFPGRRQVVFSDRFVCVVSASNPRLRKGRLARRDLEQLPLVAPFGGQIATSADAILEEAGIAPSVRVTVRGLLALPFIVSGTDQWAFVPERLLDRCPTDLDLAIAAVPLPDPQVADAAYWHPSREADPSVCWLREVLREVSQIVGP